MLFFFKFAYPQFTGYAEYIRFYHKEHLKHGLYVRIVLHFYVCQLLENHQKSCFLFTADNRKKHQRSAQVRDFSIFHQPESVNAIKLSPQLSLATFQFLSTSMYHGTLYMFYTQPTKSAFQYQNSICHRMNLPLWNVQHIYEFNS